MVGLCILIILISSGFIFHHRRNDGYDKTVTALFLFILICFSYCMGLGVNILGSYLSPTDINVMVRNCQKDLPPYEKCIITVSKPNEK